MRRFDSPRGTILSLALVLAACAAPVMYPRVPTAANVETQVERVRQLAGSDLRQLVRLCDRPPSLDRTKEQADEFYRKLMARPAPPPMQVFDNLYYVGGDWVSAWLLKTSDGLILIDALNNEEEVRHLIEGGMARLGLDPKQIKYLLITHGHGDHYGGATYLVRKYGMRVITSEIDWKMMETGLEAEWDVWGPPPARDISVSDGDKLTLGDTTVTMHVTPGHSPGTLSPVFEVRHGAKRHPLMLWGGTSFNFGRDLHRLETYSDSTERMRRVAAREQVDILISNHPTFDNSIPKMKAWAAANRQGPHPFVTGTKVVDRALQIMGICARTQHERFRL